MNQFIQLLFQQQNPQQFMLNMMRNEAGTNPLLQNIISLAEQGKTEEIENIARNMFKEKGLDFDKEFNNFKQQLRI